MEIHKDLRDKITKENKMATEFVDNIDKDIDNSLKIIYNAFPKAKKLVDEKLEKKYDFENKTFIVNKLKKNTKLTQKPDLSELDLMKEKVDNYKNTYTIVDENIDNSINELQENIKKGFSHNYYDHKEKLHIQKELLEDVFFSSIQKIKDELHRILIRMTDQKDDDKEKIKKLNEDFDSNKKKLKNILKSGDEIENTIVSDVDKLQQIEKSLKPKVQYKFLKIFLLFLNIFIIIGMGV